ncbi:MAG: beta-glucosidase [Acidobacteria bacterium]|nr:MAG: beta-glucosidase [Acidobacteriota bacterium]
MSDGNWTRRKFLAATAVLPPALAWHFKPDKAPSFPAGFLWGAATSAYQIEGAADAPGKGLSVWDEFVTRPGVIADGQTGARACDFYHLYAHDIALMRALGLKAFRFSLAWARILPNGTGTVHQSGLDFYQHLVDALLEAGIEPIATLFHWDTPLALERRSGWQSRQMADWFADYAALAARSLGDRVRTWLTINEPRSFIGGGYVAGVQAPGLRLDRKAALNAAHVVLLAHGRAVQALRANAKQPLRIGLPNDISPALPWEDADPTAALEATFASSPEHFTAAHWWDENAWWFDPVYRGTYPAATLEALGPDAPAIAAGDMAVIHQPLDFLGANVYSGRYLHRPWPPGYPETANGWPITPEALYWAPRWLYERYHLPIFITENGCARRDSPSLDGGVHDPQRADFIARYLDALARAARAGTPIVGYLHWSLLDNFEWQDGYTQRFGLVYVDFTTLRRTPKTSAHASARYFTP